MTEATLRLTTLPPGRLPILSSAAGAVLLDDGAHALLLEEVADAWRLCGGPAQVVHLAVHGLTILQDAVRVLARVVHHHGSLVVHNLILVPAYILGG